MEALEFSIIDTETTGLFPEQNDRIIEIAVVRVDSFGKIVNEYCTLINPNRDIGPVHVHGIEASDVSDAPSFKEVAGDVLHAIQNSVVVGHNVWFDKRFLEAELRRLQIDLPQIPFLCTMGLSSHLASDLPGRSLAVVCEHLGIELSDAHCALNDAKATAKILCTALSDLELREIVALLRPEREWQWSTCFSPWPALSPSGVALTRVAARQRKQMREKSFIARLISQLPPIGNTEPPAEPYLDLLDRVLEDRKTDERELSFLAAAALELGLSQAGLIDLHDRYLGNLCCLAYADGALSDCELRDLENVQKLLGVTDEKFAGLLESAKAKKADSTTSSNHIASENLPAGKSVCFTGELRSTLNGKKITRDQAHELASHAGMTICKTVTKKLNYLVVADPDSMSGKAKKAKDYGTRIVAEVVFWKMLGVGVD